MRKRLGIALLVVVAALLPTAASASAADLRLTAVGKPRFPDRSYVLSVPSAQRLAPAAFEITENGSVLGEATVSPARDAGGEFGLVLVIDASKSMAGRPIHAAVEAARALAAHRTSNQPLGIVTFNSKTSIRLPMTTDDAAIERALNAPPPLKPETHVYDGTKAAISMIERAKLAAGTVVVLSDGGDTGSMVGLPGTVRNARAEGVRVFSVGLRTGSFDPEALRQLAEGAGGRYTEATDSEQLKPIYEQLGTELSREYLVQYRSLEGPDRRVDVEVSVAGLGSVTASYRSPDIQITPVPPYEKKDFWGSTLALVLASLIAGGLLAAGLLTVVLRGDRKRLRGRVAMFVSERPQRETARREGSAAGGRLLTSAEQALGRLRWWPGFKEELEIARITVPAVRIAVLTVVGALVVTWLLLTISGSALLALPAAVAIPLAVRAFLKHKLEAQRKQFVDQLGDNLQVIASALRAGHSFIGALTVSVDEAPEPTKSEFERILADEQLGVPLEEGFETVARRMNCRDLEQVRLVATLQRETGGNTAEVLERVADTVRERGELRRQISSLTAQGRMSRWIVTALPVVLIFVINLINPEYMKPLFETPAGNAALVLAVVMITIGSLAIKRIVDIKV